MDRRRLIAIWALTAVTLAVVAGAYFIFIRKPQEPPSGPGSRPLLLVTPPASAPKIKGPSGPPPSY